MAFVKTMRKPRPTFLGVRLIEDGNEIPITEVDLQAPVARIQSVGLLPGLIPAFEEHDARIEAHYGVEEWYGLHWWERALEYAHYRVRKHAQAVSADKIEKKARSSARAKGRK